jgi:hypothetical protein
MRVLGREIGISEIRISDSSSRGGDSIKGSLEATATAPDGDASTQREFLTTIISRNLSHRFGNSRLYIMRSRIGVSVSVPVPLLSVQLLRAV